MAASGVVLKDLVPLPDHDPTEHEGVTTTMTDAPTESHALAMQAAHAAAPEEKGAAQVDHGQEVVNLGWNEPKEAVENPLVGGLSNEDLWLLVRRFNKVREVWLEEVLWLICYSKCTMSRSLPHNHQVVLI